MFKYLILVTLLFTLNLRTFASTNEGNFKITNNKLSSSINLLSKQKDSINSERKEILEEMSKYIANTIKKDKKVNLIFICTHNSRRSHISQLWSFAAANYYGISNVFNFSGGTEVSAFNHRSVKALNKVGFLTTKLDDSPNPKYSIKIDENSNEMISFSKKYDDKSNPQTDFAAIMVCSHADEKCPYISGANERFSLNYNDPKEFDNTSQEEAQYDYTVKLIGREILFLFEKVNEKLK